MVTVQTEKVFWLFFSRQSWYDKSSFGAEKEMDGCGEKRIYFNGKRRENRV